MTRSVEILVVAHRDAHARRRRGLSGWAYRVPVAEVLGRYRERALDAATIAAALDEIVAVLKSDLPPSWRIQGSSAYDRDLDEWIERAEGNAEDLRATTQDCPETMLNDLLEELYDWADLRRVSCGVPAPGRG